MINLISSTRRAFDARRASTQQWSRLEHEISGPTADGINVDHDRPDTSEMRRYLSVQTSQVV